MIDEERLYKALGAQLRKLRDGASGTSGRLTQADLANMVGLERTSITNIEKGNQKVPLHVLYKICEALGVSVDQVLPSLADVRAVAHSTLSSVEFYGSTVPLPPKAAGVISKLVSE